MSLFDWISPGIREEAVKRETGVIPVLSRNCEWPAPHNVTGGKLLPGRRRSREQAMSQETCLQMNV